MTVNRASTTSQHSSIRLLLSSPTNTVRNEHNRRKFYLLLSSSCLLHHVHAILAACFPPLRFSQILFSPTRTEAITLAFARSAQWLNGPCPRKMRRSQDLNKDFELVVWSRDRNESERRLLATQRAHGERRFLGRREG